MKKRVPLGARDTEADKLKGVLGTRGRKALPVLPSALPRSDHARRFWSERAWSEFAAIPAMAQTTLATVRGRGHLSELSALALISVDECRHAEASRDVADLLGGYVEDIPSGLPFAPHSLAEPMGYGLPFWVVGSGCINEAISLELMKARIRHTREASLRELLSRIQKDEAVHTRLSWSMAERLLPGLPQGERRQLAEYANDLFEVLTRTFATFGLPPKLRRQARRMREETARLGLGACPPDEADALFKKVALETIVPRLKRLGLPFS